MVQSCLTYHQLRVGLSQKKNYLTFHCWCGETTQIKKVFTVFTSTVELVWCSYCRARHGWWKQKPWGTSSPSPRCTRIAWDPAAQTSTHLFNPDNFPPTNNGKYSHSLGEALLNLLTMINLLVTVSAGTCASCVKILHKQRQEKEKPGTARSLAATEIWNSEIWNSLELVTLRFVRATSNPQNHKKKWMPSLDFQAPMKWRYDTVPFRAVLED